MNSIRSDASQLRQLGKSLRSSQPEMVRAVRRAVREDGRRIAQDAMQSSGEWSTRIPASFKVTNSGLVGVKIKAGGDAAPNAAPYENRGKQGTFRHPLNYPNQGHREHWVRQDARPFLLPSVMHRISDLRRSLIDAAVSAIKLVLR